MSTLANGKDSQLFWPIILPATHYLNRVCWSFGRTPYFWWVGFPKGTKSVPVPFLKVSSLPRTSHFHAPFRNNTPSLRSSSSSWVRLTAELLWARPHPAVLPYIPACSATAGTVKPLLSLPTPQLLLSLVYHPSASPTASPLKAQEATFAWVLQTHSLVLVPLISLCVLGKVHFTVHSRKLKGWLPTCSEPSGCHPWSWPAQCLAQDQSLRESVCWMNTEAGLWLQRGLLSTILGYAFSISAIK